MPVVELELAKTKATDLGDCTNLGGNRIIMDHFNHVEEDLRVGITAGNIAQACHQPVADTGRRFGVWPEEQELLEKRIRQHSNKLGGQLNLFEPLDKGFGIVNLFQGNGALKVVRPRIVI